MAVYLALSSAELTRILLFDRPDSYDLNFHPWEQAVAPSDPGRAIRFHWSEAESTMLRPVGGAIMTLLLYEAHPQMPEGGIPVKLTVAHQVVDELVLARNGWREQAYYLPPILGADTWGEVRKGRSDLRRENLEGAGAGWFAGLHELRPWHRRPGPPSIVIGLAAGVTFVPSDLVETTDDRRLGVGVAELEWHEPEEAMALGLHAWETDEQGARFRWTSRLWASYSVEPAGQNATLRIRSNHPDVEMSPVTVELYWNAAHLRTIVLADRSWHAVGLTFDLTQASAPGILSVFVDRTWRPSDRGGSSDSRRLGVAVSELSFQ